MTRRLIAVLLCAVCPQFAMAQNPAQWPTKAVRFITAFPVGGSSDQVARIVAERLTSILGQQIIIDNRSGGNGVAGTALAAAAAPDGYSFLVVFDSHATNPSLQKGIPYDTAKAFTPVMLFASSPYALAVAPTSPYRSLADLIAAAKAKPGELTLGSSGVGSRGHLAMALLEQRAGFRITQVPYRGPAQAMTDVIGGQITMMFDIIGTGRNYIHSGKVRAIAVTSRERNASLPDTPTMREMGIADYEVGGWYGLFGPLKLAPEFVARVNEATRKALAAEELKNKLIEQGYDLWTGSPQLLSERTARELALWGTVAKNVPQQ